MFAKSVNAYDAVVAKATDEKLTVENWDILLTVWDKVNEDGEPGARNCVAALQKRLLHRSANVQLFSLTLADALVSNCGPALHREISGKAFTQTLTRLVNDRNTHAEVKKKALTVINSWVKDHGRDPNFEIMVETADALKAQNHRVRDEEARPTRSGPSDDDRRREEADIQRAIAESEALAQSQSRGGSQGYVPSQPTASKDLPRQPTSPTSPPSAAAASPATTPKLVRALYDFDTQNSDELPFKKGEVIKVLECVYAEWWRGELRGVIGIFPTVYVEEIEPEALLEGPAKEAEDEARLLAQSGSIDRLLGLMRGYAGNGRRLEDNEELQDLYQSSMAMRPQVTKLIEKYNQKQEDLRAMNDKFARAQATYSRLIEERTPPVHQAPYGAPPQQYPLQRQGSITYDQYSQYPQQHPQQQYTPLQPQHAQPSYDPREQQAYAQPTRQQSISYPQQIPPPQQHLPPQHQPGGPPPQQLGYHQQGAPQPQQHGPSQHQQGPPHQQQVPLAQQQAPYEQQTRPQPQRQDSQQQSADPTAGWTDEQRSVNKAQWDEYHRAHAVYEEQMRAAQYHTQQQRAPLASPQSIQVTPQPLYAAQPSAAAAPTVHPDEQRRLAEVEALQYQYQQQQHLDHQSPAQLAPQQFAPTYQQPAYPVQHQPAPSDPSPWAQESVPLPQAGEDQWAAPVSTAYPQYPVVNSPASAAVAQPAQQYQAQPEPYVQRAQQPQAPPVALAETFSNLSVHPPPATVPSPAVQQHALPYAAAIPLPATPQQLPLPAQAPIGQMPGSPQPLPHPGYAMPLPLPQQYPLHDPAIGAAATEYPGRVVGQNGSY